MTTYNVETFVEEAVRSALAQTFPDFELIVVDDGSSDRTADRVGAIDDPRIRLFRAPHRSAPAALNFAIAQARGEYIGLLDGDDRWSPSKLEKHIRFLEGHSEIDLSFSWSRIIDEDGIDTGHRARLWHGPISFTQLLSDNVIANGSAVVMRRAALEAAGAFDDQMGGCYDLDVWLRIARLRPGNVSAIPETLTDYRRRRGQLTKDTRLMEASWLRLVAKLQTSQASLAGSVARTCCVNMYRFLSYANYEQGRKREMLRCLKLSFTNGPLIFLADYRSWGLSGLVALSLILPRRLEAPITTIGIRFVSYFRGVSA